MTIEEKAKAYDEALEMAQKATRAGSDVAMDVVQYIFPELRESEDERIVNWLIRLINTGRYRELESDPMPCSRGKLVAYLEKPSIIDVLTRAGLRPFKDGNKWCILAGDNIQEGICGFGDTIEEALYEFLKDVIDMQKEQKPAEWSGVDDLRLHQTIDVCDRNGYPVLSRWLKGLPRRVTPQSSCKPGDGPAWRIWRNGACGNSEGNPIALVKESCGYKLVSRLCAGGEKYIMLSDLEKLPGYNEK